MSSIPTNPDALLQREQTSEALKESGFPVEISTLATMATRGGGPPFRKFGTRVLYRWGDVLAWAQSRLSAPRRSTSEADAIDQAMPTMRAQPSLRPGRRRSRRQPIDEGRPAVTVKAQHAKWHKKSRPKPQEGRSDAAE